MSASYGHRWQSYVALIGLLMGIGLPTGGVGAEERAQPIKMPLLTFMWVEGAAD